MEEKVVEELKLKREIDQMRKEIEQFQASKIGFQREVEKMINEKNDLTARIELLQNHIKSYQHQTRDLQECGRKLQAYIFSLYSLQSHPSFQNSANPAGV